MGVFVADVSVVIPTTGTRNELLYRAAMSAVSELEDISLQLVICANGAKDNFHEHVERIRKVCSEEVTVTLVELNKCNVSAARNAGIASARGALIRFLDDDDYLLPRVALKQYRELLNGNWDLSTYAGRIEDRGGALHQIVQPGDSDDYGCAVLGAFCPALTFASVYRSAVIKGLAWNEAWDTTEDEDWMRRILMQSEVRWLRSVDVVGVWYQHNTPRLSRPLPSHEYYAHRASSIQNVVDLLRTQDRLPVARARAASQGLWSAVHGGFYFAPLYWTRVASFARGLDRRTSPTGATYRWCTRYVNPVVIEWIMLPKRALNHIYRIFRGRIFGWNPVRRI